MKNHTSSKSLSLIWLINFGFFLLSFFIQDISKTETGYFDIPTDQSIVCASGHLKKSTPSKIESQALFLAFAASTQIEFKCFETSSTIELTVRKDSFNLSEPTLFLKDFLLSLQHLRGPPHLLS